MEATPRDATTITNSMDAILPYPEELLYLLGATMLPGASTDSFPHSKRAWQVSLSHHEPTHLTCSRKVLRWHESEICQIFGDDQGSYSLSKRGPEFFVFALLMFL